MYSCGATLVSASNYAVIKYCLVVDARPSHLFCLAQLALLQQNPAKTLLHGLIEAGRSGVRGGGQTPGYISTGSTVNAMCTAAYRVSTVCVVAQVRLHLM